MSSRALRATSCRMCRDLARDMPRPHARHGPTSWLVWPCLSGEVARAPVCRGPTSRVRRHHVAREVVRLPRVVPRPRVASPPASGRCALDLGARSPGRARRGRVLAHEDTRPEARGGPSSAGRGSTQRARRCGLGHAVTLLAQEVTRPPRRCAPGSPRSSWEVAEELTRGRPRGDGRSRKRSAGDKEEQAKVVTLQTRSVYLQANPPSMRSRNTPFLSEIRSARRALAEVLGQGSSDDRPGGRVLLRDRLRAGANDGRSDRLQVLELEPRELEPRPPLSLRVELVEEL